MAATPISTTLSPDRAPFPPADELSAILTRCLPACRLGGARIESLALREVITGRRGKVFGLAEVVFADASRPAATRARMVLQRFPPDATAIEEGAKVFRRLRHRVHGTPRRHEFRPYAAYAREARLFVLPFPFDYRLPALVEAMDPTLVAPRLAAALGVESVSVLRAEPQRYVPEKRCQIRYDVELPSGASATVFGKVMADDRGERIAGWMSTLHGALATESGAAVPEPLGYIEPWRLFLQRAVPGATLYARQRAGDVCLDVYEAVAKTLADIHATPLDGLSTHDAAHECQLVGDALTKRTLSPTLHADAAVALEQLAAAAVHLRRHPPVTSHRDFYDKQVLSTGRRHFVIDFDTLALAPRELDLGNFVAHLHLRALQGHITGFAAQAIAESFLEAYRRRAALDDDVLDWFRRATLLRLATIYAIRPGLDHLAAPLVAAARLGLRGASARLPRLRGERHA